jgi:hypothetical protein
MAKLYLLSIIIFTSLVPIAMRMRRNPQSTVRTIQIATIVAVFFWAYACRSCYTRYVFIE